MSLSKTFVTTLALALLLASGCVSQFTSRTVASYKVWNLDGSATIIEYDSNKEHEGIVVDIDPRTGKLLIRVKKDGTPEAAIAAALDQARAMTEVFGRLLALAEKGAGITAGVPIPTPTPKLTPEAR